MGEWYATCGLSQMPIMNDDPVVVMFIIEDGYYSRSGSDYCHSYGTWSPLSFPFYGTYNDYGSYKNVIKNEFIEESLNYIRTQVIETDRVSKENINIDTIFEYIEDDSIKLKDIVSYSNKKQYCSVGQFLMHKDIYEIAASKFQDEFAQRFHHVKEQIKNITPVANMVNMRLFNDRELTRHLVDSIYDMVSKLDCDITDNIINEIARIESLSKFMDCTRRGFHPQQGAGSQEDGFEEHKTLNVFSTKYMKDVIKKYEYDDDE